MIFYALQQGALDPLLDRKHWGTQNFRYYAGQLFPILSDLDKKFYSNAEVNGSCKADPSSLNVRKARDSKINVTIKYVCEILVQLVKVIEFNIQLTIQAYGVIEEQYINFEASKISFVSVYNDTFGFKLTNKKLADNIVLQGLSRIHDDSLFGSGWPVYQKRQNPQFMVFENTTLIYDKPLN